MTHIKDNLAAINLQISHACQLANRSIDEVCLLAVSKTKSAELIQQAYESGQRAFGESYIQEAIEKIQQLAHLNDISWHFIGPIQSNKTRLIAENFSWVHSVDREKIIHRLNEQRSNQDTPLNVCLQVNISDETAKSGINVNELVKYATLIEQCDHLTLRGLMAIPKKNDSQESFSKMAELFTELKLRFPSVDTLSMGMSGDLSQAIANQSTMVRIGTAIFGEREIVKE
ncbi:YggS family pyridoxal phosphate-dependent enzyme [Colwellia sp. 1_MG-2023]|uniref:YggS family pyridoxal phosphate-dependent enzyme n=1 Tax=Colwellia sp. 1_MG-2023 TaxID=3062649 RepID=UPI0026E39A46|nr:YggS family pyridoxal phosphate-dependent enzyme [Colwellia sp. 1_MG-2023]MDO6445859.1 YggS family pyridoxal phosphate-dependent enzyme [Colwellia sp. 1_MG-2023]